MEGRDQPCKEAGRRIKAALISYCLGLTGVDSTLKRIPEDPGEGWAEIAEQLLKGMFEETRKSSASPSTGPESIQ